MTGPGHHALNLFVPAALASLTSAATAAAPPCEWAPVGGGMNSVVGSLVVFEGRLHAGGQFTSAGGMPARRIAEWDGEFWWPLATGVDQQGVYATSVFDDTLYVGGIFATAGGITGTSSLAGWKNWFWSPVGGGVSSSVFALHTVESAPLGPALYAGGAFATAGGIGVNHIAKWDGDRGGAWSPLGLGVDNIVRALVEFDGELYAGGDFTSAAGVPGTSHIAKWNGQSWTPLGSGLDGTVRALATFEGDLYAGGLFSTATGITVNHIARWDGTSWSALETGTNGSVFALRAFDDGQGEALYVGGQFTSASEVPGTAHIARWDRSGGWSALGGAGGMNHNVLSFTSFEGAIYAAGAFTTAGGAPAQRIAKWDCDSDCYANCDDSTIMPILNVDDFTCFINEFAAAQQLPPEQQIEHYANCDGSTLAPVLNVDDFTCFINAFAAGCP